MRNLQTQKLDRIVQPVAATFRNIPSTNEPNSPCMAYFDRKTFAALIPKHVAGFHVKCRMGIPQTPTQRCLNSNTIPLPFWEGMASHSVKRLNRASPRERDTYLHVSSLWLSERRNNHCTTLCGSHGEFTGTDDLDDPTSQMYRKRMHKEAKNRTQHSATPGNGHKRAPKYNAKTGGGSSDLASSSGSYSDECLEQCDSEVPCDIEIFDPRVLLDKRTRIANVTVRKLRDVYKNHTNYDVLKPTTVSKLVNKHGMDFDPDDDDPSATWLDITTLCIAADDITVEFWGSYMYVDTHYTFGFSYSDQLIADLFNAQLPQPIMISKSSVTTTINNWLPSIAVSTACAVIPHFIPGVTPIVYAASFCYGVYSRFGVPTTEVMSPQSDRLCRTHIRPEYGPPPLAWIQIEDGSMDSRNSYWPLAGFKSRVTGPIYNILAKELFKQFGAESVTTYGMARMQKTAFEKVRSLYTTHTEPDVVVNTIAFVACQMEVYRQQLTTSVRKDQTVSGLGSLLAKVSF